MREKEARELNPQGRRQVCSLKTLHTTLWVVYMTINIISNIH